MALGSDGDEEKPANFSLTSGCASRTRAPTMAKRKAKVEGGKGGHRKAFQSARDVRPGAITGRERPREIIEGRFPAYVGRQERIAFELMRRSIEEDARVFLTMSGAMTPAGLHASCIIPLIERGIVDCITTTGANLYHDAHRVIGHRIREIDPSCTAPTKIGTA